MHRDLDRGGGVDAKRSHTVARVWMSAPRAGSGRQRLKSRAVLRCTYVGLGINVGPSVQ
jgi:hypothetical protein